MHLQQMNDSRRNKLRKPLQALARKSHYYYSHSDKVKAIRFAYPVHLNKASQKKIKVCLQAKWPSGRSLTPVSVPC